MRCETLSRPRERAEDVIDTTAEMTDRLTHVWVTTTQRMQQTWAGAGVQDPLLMPCAYEGV